MTEVLKDSTGHSFFFELVDSTTGLPKTGITYTDVTLSYCRTRGARVAITPASLASASAAYSSGGFILQDDTNQPGIVRLDVPNAVFATGVEESIVTIKATGCRTVSRAFTLTDISMQTAKVPATIAAGDIATDAITAAALATDAVAEIADGIWDEVTSGHTSAGTYGGRIVRATNSNVEVQITGSNHVAADVHEFQAGVITAGDFAANSITASALAADAVTEIQSGLATAATALSTAQWTNTLATNLGTTNSTVATNFDATVSSRMATYAQPAGFLAATFPATIPTAAEIAAATEAAILNEGDATALLAAIGAKVEEFLINEGDATATLAAIAAACNAAVVAGTVGTQVGTIHGKLPTNNIADETLLETAIGSPMQVGDVTLAATQPNDITFTGTVSLEPTTTDANALQLRGNGTGRALDLYSSSGHAVTMYAGLNAFDIYAQGNAIYAQSNTSDAVVLYAGGDANGLHVYGGQSSGSAVKLQTNGVGCGLEVLSGGEGFAAHIGGMKIDGVVTLETGLIITQSTASTAAVQIVGNGSGPGLDIQGGEYSDGIRARSGASYGYGFCVAGAQGGSRMWSTGANGTGLTLTGAGTGDGMFLNPGDTGSGLHIYGGSTSGDAVHVETSGSGSVYFPIDESGITIGDVTLAASQPNTIIFDQPIVIDGYDIASMLNDVKTKSDQLTFTVANQVDANSLTGGVPEPCGARTVTITVNDGTDPLENAVVRLTSGATTWRKITDPNGVAVFSIDDATWDVSITRGSDYTGVTATLVVAADVSHTYSLTAISFTPSTAPEITGYLTAIDNNGIVQAGVEVSIQYVKPYGTGTAFDGTLRTETSDSNGLVQFTGLVVGASYRLSRGTNRRHPISVHIPTDATSPYALPSIVGDS